METSLLIKKWARNLHRHPPKTIPRQHVQHRTPRHTARRAGGSALTPPPATAPAALTGTRNGAASLAASYKITPGDHSPWPPPKGAENCAHTEICTCVTAALFATAKVWKQPGCLLSSRYMAKQRGPSRLQGVSRSYRETSQRDAEEPGRHVTQREEPK